jgi:hypothetical protein
VDCDEHIARALELSDRLLELANADRDGCEHDGCLLLDGIVRDSALRCARSPCAGAGSAPKLTT